MGYSGTTALRLLTHLIDTYAKIDEYDLRQNQARLDAGKPVLGFVNPVIYGMAADAFTDISAGDNKCSGQGGGCCRYGFAAAEGWDPVTGRGTPVYEALLAHVQALP